ncbi:hypothetical protein J5N97_002162 [Dioscorea zingiberensis]|uniref:non-specific serine/threonine protein kinase n=1 Tax=Dioscorea zingiberensis TaxID=325984 RepID=A0A9D5HPB7_9LILI|nr:hypothetical protein J5N97_002162 [Dioscorea zingiberensis]
MPKFVLKALIGCYGKAKVRPQPRSRKCAPHASSLPLRQSLSNLSNSSLLSPEDLSLSLIGSNLFVFSLAELKAVTDNFSKNHFLGEGGFGPVYKGYVDEKVKPGLKSQPVAVKLLDQDGVQGHKEWLAEVILLGQLRHPNLVKLIGYCCEDEHRLLVYEFMPRGSLEVHLFKRFFTFLPWSTRLKIAIGAAKGLAFLHEAEKQVIYRDFKASNILLDSDFKAKLSDFGLAKDGPEGDNTHVSTRVMGTHGYAAPEYIMTGHLTAKSDVYSFGVVLLELLTGRKAFDKTRPLKEQNLVEWARPQLTDARKLDQIIDPCLDNQYSYEGAQKAAQIAYHCLNRKPKTRPEMRDVVKALETVEDLGETPKGVFVFTATPETGEEVNSREVYREVKEKLEKHHVHLHKLRLPRTTSAQSIIHGLHKNCRCGYRGKGVLLPSLSSRHSLG